MTKPLVVSIAGEMDRAAKLARCIDGDLAQMETRCFPDGETYVRIDSAVDDREVLVVCSLDRPNQKVLPLIYIADTVRDLGARRVGLVAPYLAYMRQDGRFQAGEGLTSSYFGNLLSGAFDWLVTVEPHLHRHSALDHLYSIPTRIVRAAEPIAHWIDEYVDRPLLVGPDEEAEQWVSAVCDAGGFPSIIFDKVRHGDYDVQITGSDTAVDATRQAVIVDDIISTGRTMIEAVRHLEDIGLSAPSCVGIHGLFVEDALDELKNAGVSDIVTCNTVKHETNGIDIGDNLAQVVCDVLAADSSLSRMQGDAV